MNLPLSLSSCPTRLLALLLVLALVLPSALGVTLKLCTTSTCKSCLSLPLYDASSLSSHCSLVSGHTASAAAIVSSEEGGGHGTSTTGEERHDSQEVIIHLNEDGTVRSDSSSSTGVDSSVSHSSTGVASPSNDTAGSGAGDGSTVIHAWRPVHSKSERGATKSSSTTTTTTPSESSSSSNATALPLYYSFSCSASQPGALITFDMWDDEHCETQEERKGTSLNGTSNQCIHSPTGLYVLVQCSSGVSMSLVSPYLVVMLLLIASLLTSTI